MFNNQNQQNQAVINASTVSDLGSKELIETLAGNFNLSTMKKFQAVSKRISEADASGFTSEYRHGYLVLLKGYLAWDLCFNGRFDGDLKGWALMACGLLPNEFKAFSEFTNEISDFAKNYVNYYTVMAKK